MNAGCSGHHTCKVYVRYSVVYQSHASGTALHDLVTCRDHGISVSCLLLVLSVRDENIIYNIY